MLWSACSPVRGRDSRLVIHTVYLLGSGVLQTTGGVGRWGGRETSNGFITGKKHGSAGSALQLSWGGWGDGVRLCRLGLGHGRVLTAAAPQPQPCRARFCSCLGSVLGPRGTEEQWVLRVGGGPKLGSAPREGVEGGDMQPRWGPGSPGMSGADLPSTPCLSAGTAGLCPCWWLPQQAAEALLLTPWGSTSPRGFWPELRDVGTAQSTALCPSIAGGAWDAASTSS